jgi:hypothetical protein
MNLGLGSPEAGHVPILTTRRLMHASTQTTVSPPQSPETFDKSDVVLEMTIQLSSLYVKRVS